MLTCLTNEDALRLVRKTTLKALLTQLMTDLSDAPTQLDVCEQHGQWSCVSSLHHQLSRSFNCQGECGYWALWSDFTTMHPLFMASWHWWQPLLRGALAARALPALRSQALSLVGCSVEQIWTVLAAVHTRGVDEVVIEDAATWRPLLDPLPVAVQLDNSSLSPQTSTPSGAQTSTPSGPQTSTPSGPQTSTPSGHQIPTPSGPQTSTPSGPQTSTPSGPQASTPSGLTGGSTLANSAAPVPTPTDWYVLFRLLYRLSDELCTGHRVDFNQQLQSADQALDRLLTY